MCHVDLRAIELGNFRVPILESPDNVPLPDVDIRYAGIRESWRGVRDAVGYIFDL